MRKAPTPVPPDAIKPDPPPAPPPHNLDLLGGVSTLDDGCRSERDFYETPAYMTRSLLTFEPRIAGRRVLEIASGRNAIARVLEEEAGCHVVTNDIDTRHPASMHEDATTNGFYLRMAWHFAPFDWIVTNIPYDIAAEILFHAIHFPRVGLATLLPKNFDEPTVGRGERKGRGEWLHHHPWSRKICLPRHKFRAGSKHGPQMASDWFIWERDRDPRFSPCIVDHRAKERRQRWAPDTGGL